MRRISGRSRKGGIRKVTIPNLSGLTRTQARSLLSSLGLYYTESTSDTSDSNLTDYIESQSLSTGSTVVIGSSIPFSYYTYVNPITYTYGPCEAYGSPIQNLGSGDRCSGTYYQQYTDYRYNTRKKIYANGVWDGSSYSTDGCGTVDSRVVTSSNQIDGLCGYTAPPPPCSITSYSGWSYGGITWSGNCVSSVESGTASSRSRTDNCGNTYNESGSYSVTRSCTPPVSITYGSCEAYGSAIASTGSGSYCNGTYTVTYDNYLYNGRRTILRDGSWDGSSYDYSCGQVTQTVITGNSQINGSCGYVYVPPQPTNEWYCTESYNGGGVGNCGYSKPGYDNSGSGSGFSRQCVYGTSYPSCQSTNPAPVCTSYLYQCKSYDVTNSASTNYYDCYSVGACTAPRNPDGSRSVCCATYA